MKTIEKNELRIGNLFTDELGRAIFSVCEITPFWVCGADIDNNTRIQGGCQLEYEHIAAIPLTKEWAKKLGFTEAGGHYFNIKSPIQKQLFTFDRYDSTQAHIWYRDYYLGIMQRLEFVHQLQNLYFALTGEELKFKQ